MPCLIDFLADPERARGGDRSERVLDVEASRELQIQLAETIPGPKGDRVGKLGSEALPVLVADVDDRTVRLREQAPLGFEVLLHRPVEVEVVLRQVGEDEDREARSLEPALGRRHRGRFHHAGAIALVEHLAEETLQVDRLGRVETDLAHLGAHAPLDVGQQPRLLTGGREDRPEQIGGRRLAVGAGDRRDRQPCGRVAEELDRSPRHRRTNTRHDQLRSVELEPALDHERCRSLRSGPRPRSRGRPPLRPGRRRTGSRAAPPARRMPARGSRGHRLRRRRSERALR